MTLKVSESHNCVTVEMTVRISPPAEWLMPEARELCDPNATIEDEALDQVVDQARSELLLLLRQARLVTERSLALVISDSLPDRMPTRPGMMPAVCSSAKPI